MIEFLKGSLIESGSGWIVLERGGVGFKIEVPLSEAPPEWNAGEEIFLYTRLILKEDGLYLYGFKSAEERNLFNLILGVAGYGPRIALSVLGRLPVPDFYLAVIEEDLQALLKIPGIGRKTAQRLILELKEKLPAAVFLQGRDITAASGSPVNEAVEALFSLGYSRSEAAAAVEKERLAGQKPLNLEELLKSALKNLGSRNAQEAGRE